MTQPSNRLRPLRGLLLLLALLTSPLLCCGASQLLDALPATLLPSALDFTLNLFEAEARVENRTSGTLYLTALTTTLGQPQIIAQNIAFRQRDIPLPPAHTLTLKYDSADRPLAGIAVCRNATDCRLLVSDHSDEYVVEAYDTLPGLEPDWQAAIQSQPIYNYSAVLLLLFSLLPMVMFAGWLVWGRLEKRSPTSESHP